MGALADMLAHGSPDGEPQDGADGEGDDHQKLAEASVKAFFEAGKAGDFASATEHLASAMEHCEAYDDGDEPEGEHDGDGGGHPALVIAVPHKGK